MVRRWQKIEVQLTGGRFADVDHLAGRTMVLPPSTTFWQLGLAIDNAFARWDLAHARQFELADGTQVVDDDFRPELESMPWGTIVPTASINNRVEQHVGIGDRFRYVFDLGDEWTHECTVVGLSDPEEELGIVPGEPLASWGWGTIPDQYGRRWAGDDGESEPPAPLPWAPPAPLEARPFDMTAWRAALHQRSVEGMRAALTGTDPADALQRVGTGLASVRRELGAAAEPLEPLAASIHGRLRFRGWIGDELLAAVLLAQLQGRGPEGRLLAVDFANFVEEASFRSDNASGGYLNTRTGECVSALFVDGDDVDEQDRVDVESDDWISVRIEQPEWDDMATFAAEQQGRECELLERAIEGEGAFSRFRSTLGELDLWGAWQARVDERQWGEARELLHQRGILPA